MIILAKLIPEQYGDYVKLWKEKYKHRYDELFGVHENNKYRQNHRLFFPVKDISVEDFIGNRNALPDYLIPVQDFFEIYTDVSEFSFIFNFIDKLVKIKYSQELQEIAEARTRPGTYGIIDLLNLMFKLSKTDYEINENYEIEAGDYRDTLVYKIEKFIIDKIFPFWNQYKFDDFSVYQTGYINHKEKKQNIKVIKFIDKLKYLLSGIPDIDEGLTYVIETCLDEAKLKYNLFSMELVGKKNQNQEYELVISRHPYDVAGMSTDRGWRSCMELPNKENPTGGAFHEFVKHDIEKGTLICYFIKKEDRSIEHPIGRILLKPYVYLPNFNTDPSYYFNHDFYIDEKKEIMDNIGKKLENAFNAIINLNKKYPNFDIENNLYLDGISYDNTTPVKFKYADVDIDRDYYLTYFFSHGNNEVGITIERLHEMYNKLLDALDRYESLYNGDIPNDSNENKIIYEKIYNELGDEIFSSIKYSLNDLYNIADDLSDKYKTYKNFKPENIKSFFVIEPRVYGVFPDKAIKVLEDWVNNTLNKGISGTYFKDEDLYDDGSPRQADASKPQDRKRGQGGVNIQQNF